MNGKSILAALMLAAASFVAVAPATNATMTCDPVLVIVCFGDSGDDPYAGCDGTWVDTWGLGLHYHQVCMGHDGTTHIWVCPLGESHESDGCVHQEL